MSTALVYMTAKDRQEAENIGRVLVESRLAACVNIVENMQSMFWWQGSAQSESEAVLMAKTRVSLVSKVNAKVKEVHSYDCPCVVAMPIIDGNLEFLDWIQNETEQAG